MKALYITGYGGPEVMHYGEIAEPNLGPDEVLVAVRAASVNPVDYKVRGGIARWITGRRFPKVLGGDFAGEVAAIGPEVTGFAVGDKVYGYTPIMFGRPGAQAERVPVAAKRVHRVPDGLSLVEAASLPIAALTALNGLRQCGELDGRKVIVNGATGGVGHFAVQIARARGAHVTAVSSARNAERARALGAERVIDYKQEDFTRSSERWDVVFDAFAGAGFGASARVLTDHGHYVTTMPRPDSMLRMVWRKIAGGRQIVMGNMRDKPEDYATLERMIAAGQVRPIVESVFDLADGVSAYKALEGGGVVGKVVIRI